MAEKLEIINFTPRTKDDKENLLGTVKVKDYIRRQTMNYLKIYQGKNGNRFISYPSKMEVGANPDVKEFLPYNVLDDKEDFEKALLQELDRFAARKAQVPQVQHDSNRTRDVPF